MNDTHAANATAASLAPLNGTMALNSTNIAAPPHVFVPPTMSHCPVDVSLDGACRVPLHHEIFGGHGAPLLETVILPPQQHPESHFDLEPCDDNDPNQVQVALLSHEDYRRHVERHNDDEVRHERATSPTTAMLLGCTRTLHDGRTAYKVEPSFHHRNMGRMAYANYVQKRGLAKQDAVMHDVAHIEAEEEALHMAELAHEIEYIDDEEQAYEMGVHPVDHYEEVFETTSEPGYGVPFEHERAAQMVEHERERYLHQLEHDAYIQRWAQGHEHPRGPFDAGEVHKRNVQHQGLDEGEEWEARSFGTSRRGGGGGGGGGGMQTNNRAAPGRQMTKRDLGEHDEGAAWEARSMGSHNGGGRAGGGRPGARPRVNRRMNKRDLAEHDEGAAWETRSMGSHKGGGRGGGGGRRMGGAPQNNRRMKKRALAEHDDEAAWETRSYSSNGGGGRRGRGGRWKRDIGINEDDAAWETRSFDSHRGGGGGGNGGQRGGPAQANKQGRMYKRDVGLSEDLGVAERAVDEADGEMPTMMVKRGHHGHKWRGRRGWGGWGRRRKHH